MSRTITWEDIQAAVGDDFPAFVSLKDDRYTTGGYRPIIRILEQDDLRNAMIQEAYQDMQALAEKYENLKELAEIFVQTLVEMRKLLKPAKTRRQRAPKIAAQAIA